MAVVAVVASAACAGDTPTSPVADVAGPALDKGGNGRAVAKTVEVLTIDPTRTRTYRIEQNWLYVPAGAVCAPGAGYGPGQWDTPCAPATAPFQVTVTITEDVKGHPTAHFAPDMRFAPSADPQQWVVLGLKIRGKLETNGYGILFQPTGSSEWIDESLEDPTLRAWRAKGNVVARRIKHFSGYNVSLGYEEQQSRFDYGFGGMY